MNKSVYILCFLLCFFSCRKKENGSVVGETILPRDSVKYAKGFQLETHPDYTLVTVHNPWDTQRILQRYILVPKARALPEGLPEGVLIRTPLERTVSYGSVQCGFFSEFSALQTLVGVCEPQYIHIPYVEEGVRNGTIADLGQLANPDLEKIMLIQPEVLFTSPIDNSGYGQAAKLGIPFIECVDYMETSPLGRAEWIRFLALFFDKKELADSLFQETINKYTELATLAMQVERHPSVFTEKIYGGIWYQPGGNSYIAHLFRDAGVDYLWKDNTQTGSIGLSFESVLEKAENADFWLIKYNSPHPMTYGELEQEHPNYVFFDAFKKKNIYLCNTGSSPYYEELPIHPDYALKDMVRIFHPELLPGYQLRYYKKMEQ